MVSGKINDLATKALRTYSSLVGRLSATSIHPVVLSPLLHAYCRLYGVNRSELPGPLESFASFREFFTRPMKEGLRVVDERMETVVSPVDGVLLEAGRTDNPVQNTFKVKGHYYTLDELLGRAAYLDFQEDHLPGIYALFYLRPGSYHRVHSPVSGKVLMCSFQPGQLMPVNKIGRRLSPHFHVKNSRVTLRISGCSGKLDLFLVMIGALAVGRIAVTLGIVRTFSSSDEAFFEIFDPPRPVTKGQEIGFFDLGSSVMMLCYPKGSGAVKLTVPGGEIRMGTAVAEVTL